MKSPRPPWNCVAKNITPARQNKANIRSGTENTAISETSISQSSLMHHPLSNNLGTNVNAFDCTRRLYVYNYVHCKESLHWRLTLEEKSPAAPGIRTCIRLVPGVLVRRSTSWAILTSVPVFEHHQWSPYPPFQLCYDLMGAGGAGGGWVEGGSRGHHWGVLGLQSSQLVE